MASKGEEDPLEVSSDWRAAGWGKAKLTVPYPLGYGVNGKPPNIPAKATWRIDRREP